MRLGLGLDLLNTQAKVGAATIATTPGLTHWWRSTEGVGLVLGNVNTWEDQIGGVVLTAPSGGNRPTVASSDLNGYDTVYFDTTAKNMTGPVDSIGVFDSGNDFTTVHVIRTELSGPDTWFRFNTGFQWRIEGGVTTGLQSFFMQTDDGTFTTDLPDGTDIINTYVIVSTVNNFTSNGGTMTCYLDGTPGAASNWTYTTVSYDASTAPRMNVTFVGKIADFIAFDHVLTVDEHNIVLQELADRYNLTVATVS